MCNGERCLDVISFAGFSSPINNIHEGGLAESPGLQQGVPLSGVGKRFPSCLPSSSALPKVALAPKWGRLSEAHLIVRTSGKHETDVLALPLSVSHRITRREVIYESLTCQQTCHYLRPFEMKRNVLPMATSRRGERNCHCPVAPQHTII